MAKGSVVTVVVSLTFVPFFKKDKDVYVPVGATSEIVSSVECGPDESWWPGVDVQFGGQQPPEPPAPFTKTVEFVLGKCLGGAIAAPATSVLPWTDDESVLRDWASKAAISSAP